MPTVATINSAARIWPKVDPSWVVSSTQEREVDGTILRTHHGQVFGTAPFDVHLGQIEILELDGSVSSGSIEIYLPDKVTEILTAADARAFAKALSDVADELELASSNVRESSVLALPDEPGDGPQGMRVEYEGDKPSLWWGQEFRSAGSEDAVIVGDTVWSPDSGLTVGLSVSFDTPFMDPMREADLRAVVEVGTRVLHSIDALPARFRDVTAVTSND